MLANQARGHRGVAGDGCFPEPGMLDFPGGDDASADGGGFFAGGGGG